jgi:hypothetical protein
MMLRQALVALGPRTLLPVALVGSAALVGGALLWPAATSPGIYRLSLHAPIQPNAFYLSAWNEGEVLVDHDGHDRKEIVFTRRGDEHDGCTWLGIERLNPLAYNVYHYTYEERILSCRPGARPFRKTPRAGIVTVEKADRGGELTAITGVQPPADLWNQLGDCDSDDDLANLQRDVDEAMAEVRAAIREAREAADEAAAEATDQIAVLVDDGE